MGALFGARVALNATHTNLTHWLAQLAYETDAGRQADFDKETYSFDEPFPGAYEYWTRDQGRTMYFDWNEIMTNGTVVKWTDLAAGNYDSIIDSVATGLKAYGKPAFLQFGHEPESLVGIAGTAADFVNAYKHVHDRLQADGVTNVSYIWTLMAYTFRTGDADQYWPGSSYVDLVGADGYNWYKCPGRTDDWTSFTDVFDDFYNWGVAKSKNMVLSEWGSHEDPADPNRKAAWITDAAAVLQTWPKIKLVSYFDNGQPSAQCDWWVDSSSAALASYQLMANLPYFKTQLTPPPSKVSIYYPVTDNAYGNPSGLSAQGKGTEWVFTGPSNHSVTDNSGMGLFDSSTKAPYASFIFTPVVAANYNYKCTLHAGMTGTFRVPILASPPTGGTSTTFTITWASAAPPAGYVVDVQIQRPGSSVWTIWQSSVRTTSASFVPDSGVGTYSFRSRIKKSATGAASWYSESVSISVH